MLVVKLLSIFDSSSMCVNMSSGTCNSSSSEHIVKIASVSANEPLEIFRKLMKSFAVLLFFPSAIFKETDTTALLSCCFRLYSSDFGSLSASA